MGRSALLRTFAGFAVGPISPALLLIAIATMVALLTGKSAEVYSGTKVAEAWWLVKIAALVGYPVAFAGGVPVYVFLRWRRWDRLTSYAVSGGALGGIVVCLMVILGFNLNLSLLSLGAMTVVWSVVAATCFWLIARPDRIEKAS